MDIASALQTGVWRTVELPSGIQQCMTMLSLEERQLLFWCTSDYYQGLGAIVDCGPFVGGSTMALAAGLEASRSSNRSALIHSYDQFECEPYMEALYFAPAGESLQGTRFRHIYDRQTLPYRNGLCVYDGDIKQFIWQEGSKIEILFIDICKNWNINDHCSRMLFPKLIGNHSLVVHQDYFDCFEHWVAIEMEVLSSCFQFVGFANWNSAIFRCIEPPELEAIPTDLFSLGLDRLESLMDQAIARHSYSPYHHGMMLAAKAGLLLDFRREVQARNQMSHALEASRHHPLVRNRLALLEKTRLAR